MNGEAVGIDAGVIAEDGLGAFVASRVAGYVTRSCVGAACDAYLGSPIGLSIGSPFR
jgi:hypothetical protein